MNTDLQSLRSLRPRSLFEGYFDRLAIYEQAGSRMPQRTVVFALVEAALTLGIGLGGFELTGDTTSGFVGFLHTLFLVFACLGGLLVIAGAALSMATNARSRDLMRVQLIAGAIAPGLVLAAIALDIAWAILWLCLIGGAIWAWATE